MIKRLIAEICRDTGETVVDFSSIPRLFSLDTATDTLAEAYERLPAEDRAKIESVKIFEDAA